MAGKTAAVVLAARFTTYVGAQAYYTAPVAASAYERLRVTFWHGPYLGAGTAVALKFEWSNDLDTWHDCAGGPWNVPGAVGESDWQVALDAAWMRFGVVLTGTNPGVTCWAQGGFELRER